MNHTEKRLYLIRWLLDENHQYQNLSIPRSEQEQAVLLRGLINVRSPRPIDREFLEIQNEYLKETIIKKGITDISDLSPVRDGNHQIYIWQGDITTLKCDAIVNAANSGMTGCYVPNHTCIDNCIHTFSGVQLRLECAEIMNKQGFEEPTGTVKITKAYNLPCRYVLHTVGPIISDNVTEKDEKLLASCYRSCLDLAEKYQLESIAFCCISTGVFGYPNNMAAKTAVETVSNYLTHSQSIKRVIFNVFKDIDKRLYTELLG